MMYLVNLFNTENGCRETAIVPFEWNTREREKLVSGEYSHWLGREFLWRVGALGLSPLKFKSIAAQHALMKARGPIVIDSVQVKGEIVYSETGVESFVGNHCHG